MSEDTYRDMQKVLVALILNDVDLFHLKSQFINKLRLYPCWHYILCKKSVLAVDDRHIAYCEYNGSVARIICVAVATLANGKF
jgi:hypothetical protein